MKKIRHVFLFFLLFTSALSANTSHYVESDIYLGLSKPDGSSISEQDFNRFKDAIILPRFKSGLSIAHIDGVWKSQDGHVVNESTRLVIIIYNDNSEDKNKIKEIAENYKKMFQQDSVLVVTKSAAINFY